MKNNFPRPEENYKNREKKTKKCAKIKENYKKKEKKIKECVKIKLRSIKKTQLSDY